jgi:hypothetical protein
LVQAFPKKWWVESDFTAPNLPLSFSQRILRGGLPVYGIKDFNDDEIKGTFYQSELQKTDVKDDDLWKMEQILKTRGKGLNKQYFAKWLHWANKFNSWQTDVGRGHPHAAFTIYVHLIEITKIEGRLPPDSIFNLGKGPTV